VLDNKIDKILDAIIAAAPECLRQRVILQGIDWSIVGPHKVSLLLQALDQEGLSLPGWLSKSLLLAGHILEGAAVPALPTGLAVLNRLNAAGGDADERAPIAASLASLEPDPDLDPALTTALVRRLMALSWDDEALRLALAQYHRAPSTLNQLGSVFDDHVAQLPTVRLVVSGTSTTWTLIEALRPAFSVEGLRADITESSYGNVLVDLMSPPDHVEALVVLIDHESFAPRDWRLSSAELERVLIERAELLGDALEAFSANSRGTLLINTIPAPSAPTAGFLDRRHVAGLRRAVDMLNQRILDAAEKSNRILVVDSDYVLSTHSRVDRESPKLWFYGRIAYSAEATRALARAFAEGWRSLRRGPAKVLAVDFDNTLWGGVYGDDGVERLACGHDAPGNAFRAFQMECLRLKAQGLLLVALSKNNADAVSAFERHPGMVLRASDFTATAINWEPKATNIRRLAADLNLGLDSFVFLDDSPHEREAMRQLCPEVIVPELPSDPAERPSWLRKLTVTWPIRLTQEDGSRAELYAVADAARSAKAGAASLEAYLSGLNQHLVVSLVNGRTLSRAAQMHQRTNQFNLTTLRLTEPDIAAFMKDDGKGFAVLGRASDRFGDHGIVIVATVAIDGEEATIRTLLMSCRVIGREVERAFLAELLREAGRRGVRRIRGHYAPTPKNDMVRDFYATAGFELIGDDGGKTSWVLVVDAQDRRGSDYVMTSWEN
jgi:FkbH-like protein